MKTKIYLGLIALSYNAIAQQNPTGTPPPGIISPPNLPNTINQTEKAWYRGGNINTGSAASNNIFGTMWNSPVYHYTSGQQRMVLMGQNPAGSISGALGLGTITPLSYFHINSAGSNNTTGRLFRTDGIAADFNQWQFFTGGGGILFPPSTEKFKLFVRPNAADANLQSTAGQMIFNTFTNGGSPSNTAERMRLSYGTGGNLAGGFNAPGVTKVLISHDGWAPFGNPIYLPPAVAMLNLGSSSPNPSAGNRPWMDVGTYYSMHTDNMYVGLKDGGSQNYSSAVINWGDDPSSSLSNNRLLYVFTGFGGQGRSSSFDGLEVGRMWADSSEGRMGIGGDPVINKYSLGSLDPKNTLEVNSVMQGALSPYNPLVTGSYPLSTGASGLRFTDLTSKSLIVPTTSLAFDSTKVLSVDTLGNVILIKKGGLQGPAGPAGGIINAQNGLNLLNPSTVELGGTLLRNTTINQGTYYYEHTGTGGVSTFAIYGNGGTSMSALDGAAHDFYSYPNAAGNASGNSFFVNNGTGLSNDIYGNSVSLVGSTSANAYGTVSNTGNTQGSNFNFYVNQGTPTPGSNVGYYASVSNGATNYGVNVSAQGSGSNYGVYGSANGGTTNYAGYFTGNVYIAGSFGPSDANLKQNVDTIPNALGLINQLKPKKFDYKHSSYPSMNLPTGLQYGLIAQDVQSVMPALVTDNIQPAVTNSLGAIVTPSVAFKGLEYEQLIPVLIQAVQQLSSQNHKQDSLITELTNQIASCCSNASAKTSNSNINQLDVELSDKDAIVLNQNVPNPFAEQTTITYNVPAKVAKAQILFYNTAGQIIQTVDIKTRGKGKVNVFASDLSSGLYHYTLIADGVVIDSKKMVRE